MRHQLASTGRWSRSAGGGSGQRWIEQVLGLYHRARQRGAAEPARQPRHAALPDAWCSGDEAALRLAILFQMTYPGAPCLYYGDEIGIGAPRLPQPVGHRPPTPAAAPGCPGTPGRWNTDLHDYVKRAIALRNAHPVLRRGDLPARWAATPPSTPSPAPGRGADARPAERRETGPHGRPARPRRPAGRPDSSWTSGAAARPWSPAARSAACTRPQSGAVLMVPPGIAT